MKRILHLCQSVDGALKNWDKKTWASIGKDNGMTGAACKKHFELYKHQGKKVIPLSDPPCEGFSYENGCPGHEDKEP